MRTQEHAMPKHPELFLILIIAALVYGAVRAATPAPDCAMDCGAAYPNQGAYSVAPP